uniref:Uncharacterized protein n=1 Tax=Solanum tuberosum TaxID=4113 RepID=M1DRW3_SOLTU
MFQDMKERPPYRDIHHTLCGVNSTARSLLTRYLHTLEIEKVVHDVCPYRAFHLVCHLVDVTKIKAKVASHGPMLPTTDMQARDDSWMGSMYVMDELQLRIGGHLMTEDEMAMLVERYPLMDNSMYICRLGPTF